LQRKIRIIPRSPRLTAAEHDFERDYVLVGPASFGSLDKLSVTPVGSFFHFPAELLDVLAEAGYGIAPDEHYDHQPHQDAKSEFPHKYPPQKD
jgi:hypothetical protein